MFPLLSIACRVHAEYCTDLRKLSNVIATAMTPQDTPAVVAATGEKATAELTVNQDFLQLVKVSISAIWLQLC